MPTDRDGFTNEHNTDLPKEDGTEDQPVADPADLPPRGDVEGEPAPEPDPEAPAEP